MLPSLYSFYKGNITYSILRGILIEYKKKDIKDFIKLLHQISGIPEETIEQIKNTN